MPLLEAFHDVRFPVAVAFGASGGPERRTEIVTLGSGHEQRNARWQNSRRRFDAGHGVKDLDDLYAVTAFFEERRGALHGFRFRDPLDWKSCPPLADVLPTDQEIGIGDGTTSEFQLSKSYGTGETAYRREIGKPVAGTELIEVGGIPQSAGTDYLLDADTGRITFLAGRIPSTGAVVTAGFEFDVPVRFDTEALSVNIAAFQAGDIPSIPLVEIKL